MAIVLTNNAESVITSAITSGATTISIVVGDASRFPALTTTGDYAIGVLEDITTTPTTREIVQVTARAANSLTIVRAQEGTAASAFPINATFSLRLTAGAVAQYLGSVPLVIPNLFITTAMLKDGAAAGTKLYAPDIVATVQATAGIIGSSNLASGLTLAGATSLTGALGVTGASTFTSGTFSTPLSVSSGGTGAVTLTNHGVLLGSAASPLRALAPNTAGFQLTDGGAGVDPSWAAPFFSIDSGNLSGTRVLGTTYTNSSGRPMWAEVYGSTTSANSTLALTIDGRIRSQIGQAVNGYGLSVNGIVPAGKTYTASVLSGSVSVLNWEETT